MDKKKKKKSAAKKTEPTESEEAESKLEVEETESALPEAEDEAANSTAGPEEPTQEDASGQARNEAAEALGDMEELVSAIFRAYLTVKMSEISKLNDDIAARDQHIQELTQQVEQGGRDLAEARLRENDVGTLQLENSRLQAECDELKTRLQTVTAEASASAQAREDELKRELEDLRSRNEQVTGSLSSVEAENLALGAEVTELKGKLEALQQVHGQTHTRLQEAQARNAALQSDNKDMMEQVSSLRQQTTRPAATSQLLAGSHNHDDGEDVHLVLEERLRELTTALNDANRTIYEYQVAAGEVSEGDERGTGVSGSGGMMEDVPLYTDGPSFQYLASRPPLPQFEPVYNVRIDLTQVSCAGIVGNAIAI